MFHGYSGNSGDWNDKPENPLFRHIFLDTARLADIAIHMPEVDRDKALAKDAYLELAQYFRVFDPTHFRKDEVFRKLGYIDEQNLLSRIKGKVLFMAGCYRKR